MLNTNIFRYLIVIFSLFLTVKGYCQIEDRIEEKQYSINYSIDSYDDKKKHLISHLNIHLKQKIKIFVKNHANEGPQSRVALENKRNINSVEIKWPTPKKSTNDAFYYTEDLNIPILINLIDPNSNTEFDLNILIAVCDKFCSQKSYMLHFNIPASLNSGVSSNVHLFEMLVIAFVGGIVLNFMPCVLPVLSIKLLSIINARQQTRQKIRHHFLATIFGIITLFLIFASIAHLLKAGGEYVGLGLNFQQPQFVTFLVLSLIFFACNLDEKITISLPTSLSAILSKYSNESKIVGSFLSGAFATLIATSCTAPFVGSALSFSLLYGKIEIYSIFFCLALGMSLPYIILAVNPGLIKHMPKQGKWILLLKKFLAILVYLTVLWLIFIISNLLDTKAAVILFMLSLLLKFFLENKQGLLKYGLIKIIVCVLIITGGFFLPKLTYKDDTLRQEEVLSVWKKFTLKKLNEYIAAGKIVLVDVSADWCVTCKYNKFVVLDNEYMLSYYKKHNIIVMRADYTSMNKEVSDYLESYNRRGIPFDVIYSKKYPRGIILPTILKTSDVIGGFDKARTK
ncbi:MAG: thioredoxin family protein [Alphaproteobacteria bacterium]|jgi:suppressor for copper-sensitivity B